MRNRYCVSLAALFFWGGVWPAVPALGAEPVLQIHSKDGLKYVQVPAGTFVMGCSEDPDDCFANEKPAHTVTISKSFWIGQTEVTVGAWEKVMASNRSREWRMPQDEFGGDYANKGWINKSLPMVNVTWADASRYCESVGGRLPTEAEWEYAARAGTENKYNGGIGEHFWYRGNSKGRPHVGAELRPNAFGLYDTLGNVWEWVNDWLDLEYYGVSPATDPTGPSSPQYPDVMSVKVISDLEKGRGWRVVRGGSYRGNAFETRLSTRSGMSGLPTQLKPLGDARFDVGFRCAAGKLP